MLPTFLAAQMQEIEQEIADFVATLAAENASVVAENASVVAVVSEDMVEKVGGEGDLELLHQWARQGVRVVTFRPLVVYLLVMCRGNVRSSAIGGYWASDALVLNLMRGLVLELGANVNQVEDHSDLTALIWRVTIGAVEIVRCLVTELGADVNQTSHDGRTPLYFAVPHPYEGDQSRDCAMPS
jgi:hypothetical protein